MWLLQSPNKSNKTYIHTLYLSLPCTCIAQNKLGVSMNDGQKEAIFFYRMTAFILFRLYLFKGRINGDRRGAEIFHLVVHSPNAHSIQGPFLLQHTTW